jgi:hypothetical protein
LCDNTHTKAHTLKEPAQQGCPEGWMVDVGIGGDESDIDLLPTTPVEILL